MATKTSKLKAVNTILSNIGQAPTNSLDIANPMVALAQNILDDVSTDVQSEGWTFNSEQQYPFTPDASTKEIAIPVNILQIDSPHPARLDVVVRQNKLYDRANHTYRWDESKKLNVVWLLEWEDLPEAAKQYISIRAANLFAMRATGSAEVAKYSEREEGSARAALIQYECEQGDYSIFSDGTGTNPTRSYMPLNTIWRY